MSADNITVAAAAQTPAEVPVKTPRKRAPRKKTATVTDSTASSSVPALASPMIALSKDEYDRLVSIERKQTAVQPTIAKAEKVKRKIDESKYSPEEIQRRHLFGQNPTKVSARYKSITEDRAKELDKLAEADTLERAKSWVAHYNPKSGKEVKMKKTSRWTIFQRVEKDLFDHLRTKKAPVSVDSVMAEGQVQTQA